MMLEIPTFDEFIQETEKETIYGVSFWSSISRPNLPATMSVKILLTCKKENHVIIYTEDMGEDYETNRENLKKIAENGDKRLLEIKKILEKKGIKFRSGRWLS